MSKDALAQIGGFGGGIDAVNAEQVAAVAMAILRSLKKVAFSDVSIAPFPLTFVHRGMSATRTLQLVATIEQHGDPKGMVVIDTCPRELLASRA